MTTEPKGRTVVRLEREVHWLDERGAPGLPRLPIVDLELEQRDGRWVAKRPIETAKR